ncbi:SRPBCC domain-containing protein [Actinoplanes sp. GCM10030250]|uniref:SRPBCC domain-containing protein n=1 Tax=Actinoplanes sp. GCM10030250 TaxID=3273376 RepID=UPI003614F5DE
MTEITNAVIEADAKLPIIRITRDFAATPEQLMRAHTDQDLFVQWNGPDSISSKIDYWDARTGGSWRYLSTHGTDEIAFHGSFHHVGANKIVQTFTWEGQPDGVSLETVWFEDLGDGRTRLHAQSLVDSFEGRDAWLQSGMEVGVNDGYAKLQKLVTDGKV